MDDNARGRSTMTPATRTWVESLLRLVKGMVAETEKWLKAEGQQ